MNVRPCRPVFRLSALLLMLLAGARAATIEQVVIRSGGADAAPQELVAATVGSAVGETFDARLLAEDVKRLYQTGFFADVQSSVTESGPERVIVTFTVVPKPQVREIRFTGNSLLTEKKLRRPLTQAAGAVLDENKVLTDLNALRKLYRDKGHHQTDIVSEITALPDSNDVVLTYVIREEPRNKVREVRFRGNTVFTAKELRRSMETRASFWNRLFRIGYFSDEQLRQDLDVLYEMYTSRGYLDFKVFQVERDTASRPGWIGVVLYLDEGQPYTVTRLDYLGNTRFSTEDLQGQVRLAAGEVYDSGKERTSVERIRARYEALGYIDLRVVPRHEQDPVAHTLAITFDISEGVPSRVRDVLIAGNEVTRDNVIRRELPILPGDLANAGVVRAARSRLMDMDYFEKVEITPRATEQEDLKDIQIDVTEKRTGQFMIGVGVSSEDSVAGYMEIAQKNFDWRNWPTFTGGGQRLRMRLSVGTEYQDVMVSFTEPWFLDRPLRMDWDLFARERDQDYYTEGHLGTSVMFTQPLKWDAAPGSELSRWRHGLGYRLENASLDDFDNSTAKWVRDEEGDYLVSGLRYRLSRYTTDRSLNPTRGSRFEVSAGLDPELLGSYGNVYRLQAEAAKYWPLRKTVFKLEVEAGMVDSLSGEDPKLFDRYFAGGLGSLRGFERREVGPTDRPKSDKAVGGGSLLRGTAEWMFPIYDMVRGSVFCDAGNVWWDPYAWDPTQINASVGVGIQLDLPIGPIRLDYGYPILIDQDHIDGGGKLHFNVGYFF